MINFPTKEDADGIYFSIRIPNVTAEFVEVELNASILAVAPGFVLEKLAEIVLGDASKWHLIEENNVVKYPGSWAIGDVVRIPNIRDAEIDQLETVRVFN